MYYCTGSTKQTQYAIPPWPSNTPLAQQQQQQQQRQQEFAINAKPAAAPDTAWQAMDACSSRYAQDPAIGHNMINAVLLISGFSCHSPGHVLCCCCCCCWQVHC
jgi:hypothetical protein